MAGLYVCERNLIRPERKYLKMILIETVRASHEELGRPTDDATVQKVFEEANTAARARGEAYLAQMKERWIAENGTTQIPGQVVEMCSVRAFDIAKWEIIEEWFSEPIRALIDEKVARGEDGW